VGRLFCKFEVQLGHSFFVQVLLSVREAVQEPPKVAAWETVRERP